MKQYALLLAGGQGKRLWPFSRKNTPKQFITLPNGKTLLETTLERIQPLFSIHKIIITTHQYNNYAQSIAQQYNAECLSEQEGKNTAPAVAWSLRTIRQRDGDAIVVIMPTDHTIQNTEKFQQTLTYAIDYARIHKTLVLYGSPQKYITTKFGFISYHNTPLLTHNNTFSLYPLKKFHEKPPQSQAEIYYQDAHTVWNMGIFVAQTSLLWELFLEHAPDILDHLDDYSQMPSRSFDRAIVEKSTQHITVLPYDFGWNDIGSLDAFIPAFPNSTQKNGEITGAYNNTIVSTKPVIVAGASNLVIIEMHDMILIAQRNILQSPELITEQIHRLGLEELI